MIQKLFIRLAAILLLASPAAADSDEAPRTISISAVGYVNAVPDIAHISLGVTTEAGTAQVALKENNERLVAVLAAVKQMGVAAKDIMTEHFSVAPVYERVKKGSRDGQQIAGFRVRNAANVTVRNMKQIGDLIDQATQAGANQIGNIYFTVSKLELKLDFARQQAMRNAIRRAKLFAEEAGARLGPIQTITERMHGGQQRPRPMYRASARMAATPIEAGEQKLGITVTGVWSLD